MDDNPILAMDFGLSYCPKIVPLGLVKSNCFKFQEKLDGIIKIASNFKDMKSPSPQNPIPNNWILDNEMQAAMVANYHLSNQTDSKIARGKFISWKMTRT